MIEELLIDQRLNPGAVGLLMNGISSDSAADVSVEKLVSRRLARLISFDSRLPVNNSALALIGPSSAGKSTSLAKLALRIRETFALRVGIISVDAFKTNTNFHMHTFAMLTGMPCYALPNNGNEPENKDISEAINALSDCEIILIDTVESAAGLEGIECQKMLTLPAHLSAEDLRSCCNKYSALNYERLMLTHLDKCGYAGPLVESLLEHGKPLAFFGTGTRVPVDIEPAAARRLARMLTRTIQ